MSSVNKAIIVGRVGKEPEIRATQSGKEIASFSVATSERWRDKNTGEQKEATEWHRVVVFNEGLVGVVKNYVKKGTQLYIEGKVKTRAWEDNTGTTRYSTEIVLQGYNGNLTLLGGRSEQSAHDTAKQDGYAPQNELDDEIPF